MADDFDDAGDGLGVERDAEVVIHARSQPVPGQFRTTRRVALISVLLTACRQSQASLAQLHVLNWAVRSPESRQTFLGFIQGFVPPDEAIVRFDPTLPRAIQYAIEEGVVSDRAQVQETLGGEIDPQRAQYRLVLTKKGEELAGIVADAGLLVEERLFLEGIGKKVTQSLVESLLDWGHA